MFCVSVKLWTHSDLPIWVPFYLDPEDVRNLRLGAIWDFINRTGLPWLGLQSKEQKKKDLSKAIEQSGPKGRDPIV